MHLFALFFFPIFGFGFVMYFLPSILALARNNRDTVSIFVRICSLAGRRLAG